MRCVTAKAAKPVAGRVGSTELRQQLSVHRKAKERRKSMTGTGITAGAASTATSSAKKKKGGPGNPSKIVAHRFKKNDPATGFRDERINRTALQTLKRTIIDDIHEDLATLELCHDGKHRTNSMRVAMALRTAALRGKVEAARELLDRTVGRVPTVGTGTGDRIPPSGTEVNVTVNAQAIASAQGESRNAKDPRELVRLLDEYYGLARRDDARLLG
jgi:hypothetical protein